MKRMVIGAITALLAVLAASATVPNAASAAPEPYRFKVIEQNIAGGMIFRGDPAAITYLNQEIEAYQPDLVVLEEVCESQRQAFEASHPGWYFHHSDMTTTQDSCAEHGVSETQGEMIASPWPLSNLTNPVLPKPPVEDPAHDHWAPLTFHVTCANVAVPGHVADGVRACGTHLLAAGDDPTGTWRAKQTATIGSWLGPRATSADKAVILAGDFNIRPWSSAMDSINHLRRDGTYGGPGDFYEADSTDPTYFSTRPSGVTCAAHACRTGQPTTVSFTGGDTAKLDHIFVSSNVTHGGRVSGLALNSGVDGCTRNDPLPTRCGDHRVYRAFFDIIF